MVESKDPSKDGKAPRVLEPNIVEVSNPLKCLICKGEFLNIGPSGLKENDIIEIFEFKCIAGLHFQISSEDTPANNLVKTTKNFVSAFNRMTDRVQYKAIYASEFEDLPGKFLVIKQHE